VSPQAAAATGIPRCLLPDGRRRRLEQPPPYAVPPAAALTPYQVCCAELLKHSKPLVMGWKLLLHCHTVLAADPILRSSLTAVCRSCSPLRCLCGQQLAYMLNAGQILIAIWNDRGVTCRLHCPAVDPEPLNLPFTVRLSCQKHTAHSISTTVLRNVQ